MSDLVSPTQEIHGVRTIKIDEEPWYILKDCLIAIGSQTRTADAKTSIISELGESVVNFANIKDSLGREQKIIVINEIGLRHLLTKSRKSDAQSLALKFGIVNLLTPTKEAKTIKIIKNAFAHLQTVEQFFVSGFRIDLYFPQHRIAVECDEKHHQNPREKKNDIARQDLITKTLGCRWVRYYPDEPTFCIGKTINTIMTMLNSTI